MPAGDLAGRVGSSLLAAVAEFNAGRRGPTIELAWDAPLYGDGGPLDSLGLVQLIVAVEQRLEDDLGVAIALADERALSQRRSPFRSLGALRDFVVSSLDGTKS